MSATSVTFRVSVGTVMKLKSVEGNQLTISSHRHGVPLDNKNTPGCSCPKDRARAVWKPCFTVRSDTNQFPADTKIFNLCTAPDLAIMQLSSCVKNKCG